MLTIRQRTNRAEQALNDYTDDDPATGLIDLLADLMHWSRHTGHSFDQVLGTARMHFEHELATRKKHKP